MKANNGLSKTYEYIIIGTGPGGGTAARELARAGKNVLMIEKGAWHEKLLGFPFGLRILKGFGYFSKSIEGVYTIRGITVGGSSMVYNANVYDPPGWLYEKMDLNFQQEADELKKELTIYRFPEEFFKNATGGNRIREAADKMGLNFKLQEKFIDPDKCKVGCDWCMLGCNKDAKWTTREYVKEAMQDGATLMHSTSVKKIAINGGRATGVILNNGKIINGDKIIVAAGGIGTAEILIKSGLSNVGKSFFMDPMHVLTAYADDKSGGAWGEMTFSHAIEDFEEDGFMIGNVAAQYAAIATSVRFNLLRKNFFRALPLIRRGVGLFVKLADNPHGEVFENGKFSKRFDDDDRKRMNKGVEISKEILIKAGIKPSSIAVGEWMGGHPGGTASIGKVVDKNFQTEYENLFVCDASVLPVSPGAPPSFTIMAFSRLFAKMQIGTVKPEDRKAKVKA